LINVIYEKLHIPGPGPPVVHHVTGLTWDPQVYSLLCSEPPAMQMYPPSVNVMHKLKLIFFLAPVLSENLGRGKGRRERYPKTGRRGRESGEGRNTVPLRPTQIMNRRTPSCA